MLDEALQFATLVGKGIARFGELIPLWFGAKTPEERERIRVSAQQSVDALDPHFAKKDEQDKAVQDDLQKDIDAAGNKSG
jgi:hypothetical protein